MRKALLISYWFPPRQPEYTGRHAAGLAKYLPEFGWEPYILTASLPPIPNGRYHVLETPYRDSLHFIKRSLGLKSEATLLISIAELKKKLRIKSEGSLLDIVLRLGGEIFAYPDLQKGWKKPAIEKADELLKTKSVDAILSMSLPVTSHLIAADLKRKYGIPWVAYFLDLWTLNHYYPYGRLRRGVEQRLEIRTMAGADILVTISQPLAENLSQLHLTKPVETITLGFDPEELEPPLPKLSDKFTITYTGNIYPRKQSPELLFEALSELLSEGVIDTRDIEVRFYGPELGWLQQQIVHYHLEDMVNQFGFVNRQVCLEKQRESQLLLVLDWMDVNERGVYNAKVFEYLSSQRPIVAIGGSHNGVLYSLLEEVKSGVHCRTVEETKDFLRQAYQEYKYTGHVSYKGDIVKIMNYSYEQMANKFSELLSRLATTTGRDTEG